MEIEYSHSDTKLLKAFQYCSHLLIDDADFETTINQVLATTGEAADVDRVYIFKNHYINGVCDTFHHTYEWSKAGVSEQIENEALMEIPWEAFGDLKNTLIRERLFYKNVALIEEEHFRKALEEQEIKSIVFVPIFHNQFFWGFIGFDDCMKERVWNELEIALLTSISANIGLYLKRHELQYELQHQKKFFESILHNIPGDIAVFDTQARYIFINNSAIRNDETRAWIIGKTDFDYCAYKNVPLDRAQKRLETFDKVINERIEMSFEETYPDGTTKIRNYFPVVNKLTNELDYIIGYGLDITHIKQKDEIIHNQIVAIENSTDGVALLKDGCYYYMNKAHAGYFGYDNPAELYGKNWQTIYEQDEANRLSEEAFPVLSETGHWTGPTMGKSKDGSKVPQDISLTILPNGELLCVCRDMSERLKHEAEIRRLAMVAQKSKTMVMLCNKDLQVEWVNDAFSNVTGYCLDEVKGKTPEEFLHGEETDLVTNKIARGKIATGQSCNYEILNYSKNKEKYWVYVDVTPYFNASNELDGYIMVKTDITPKKQAEEEMKSALEQERKLGELKTKFVNLASHEFRTPLAGIQISADIIQMLVERINAVDNSIKSKLDKHVSRISSEIFRMTEIMNNVLLMGKIDAGRVQFRPEKSNMVSFIRHIVRDSFSKMPDGRTVITHVKGEPVDSCFDVALMEHIMKNMLSNAFKYSEGKGNPEVTITFEPEKIYIDVKDFGIGIPEHEQNMIFQSFFRGSNTDTIQGTGLGMVIIKQFIELHAGTITFSSKTNEGSVFTLMLPVVKEL